MIDVVKALVRRENKYLALKRSPSMDYFPDHWDLPGGNVEAGEDPKACVEREITEETGLSAKATEILDVYEIDIDEVGSPTHRFTIYNTESYFGEVRISQEHAAYGWKTRDEILNLDKLEPYMIKYFEDHSES